MKGNGKILALAGLLAMHGGETFAATIGWWDFNSAPPDASASTGTITPAAGLGVASLVGGVTATFAAGSGSDPGADNTGWSTAAYPAAAAGNKTAGVQFRISTRGYTNVAVSWEQRVSGSASRYSRFQYSIDGTEFLDGDVVIMPSNNTYYARSISLDGISAANNNGSFVFRLVSEFEGTAVGIGANAYVTPLGASYSTAGTVRFDAVRVTGVPINPENTPPTIEPLPDLMTLESQPITAYPVVLSDDGTPAAELVLRVASANTNLIPVSGVQIAGNDYERAMTITPQPGLFGQSRITLIVSDAEALTSSVSFLVTVTPANVPPVITAITHQRQVAGAAGAVVPFVVDDTETPAGDLGVSVTSSAAELITTEGLVLGGADRERTLRFNPVPGRFGTALITVQVTDGGGRSDATSFVLTVVPAGSVMVAETFGYLDGPLVERSAGFWVTHAGTTGQVQVAGGSIGLGGSRTEDVHVVLPGGPIETGVIYASFNVRFSALPTGNEFFAHWNHASSFRARIVAATNNAAHGTYRLAVGNGGSSGLGQFPRDLSLNTTYTVVLRYDASTASSALWLDPSAESETPVLATDTTTGVPVASFSFRNATGLGAILVDTLRLGRVFADVTGSPGLRLEIAKVGDDVEISWPDSANGYRLQSNTSLEPAGWVEEAQVPEVSNGRSVLRLPDNGVRRIFRLVR